MVGITKNRKSSLLKKEKEAKEESIEKSSGESNCGKEEPRTDESPRPSTQEKEEETKTESKVPKEETESKEESQVILPSKSESNAENDAGETKQKEEEKSINSEVPITVPQEKEEEIKIELKVPKDETKEETVDIESSTPLLSDIIQKEKEDTSVPSCGISIQPVTQVFPQEELKEIQPEDSVAEVPTCQVEPKEIQEELVVVPEVAGEKMKEKEANREDGIVYLPNEIGIKRKHNLSQEEVEEIKRVRTVEE